MTSHHPATGTNHASEVFAAIDTFDLLREAADHEALYTLVGGLKPMSTGIWHGSFTVDDPDLADLRELRAALAPICNDIWYADVQVFDNIHDGERSVHAFVVHRAAMARMIERFEEFWSPWGITLCTHPSEVVAVVDRMPKADRWRGYGYLFGYPSDAVDFFVEAGLASADGGEVGPDKDRRFMQIPTYAAETGRFTYAVPLDHVGTAADEAIASEASRILAAYTERKGRMRDARSMLAELRRLNQRFESRARSVADGAIAALDGGVWMPTYDYFCPENGREVAVFHAMSVRIATWGELCDLASIDVGPTARESPVQRQIGAGIVLARRPDQMSSFGAGCCGVHGCGD